MSKHKSCYTCDGSGYPIKIVEEICARCGGHGNCAELTKGGWSYRTELCSKCNGRGVIIRHRRSEDMCEICGGTGVLGPSNK